MTNNPLNYLNQPLSDSPTPVFVFDKGEIINCAKKYQGRQYNLYYSVKACLFKGLVKYISPLINGFSVSSVTELETTREETQKPVHFVSPLIRDIEIKRINSLANSITFNSLEQYKRYHNNIASHIKIFLRVNPEQSIVEDDRYNPCRQYSKLGIPIDDVREFLLNSKTYNIHGIHFHNACQTSNITKMIKIVNKIKTQLADAFSHIQSINIGGGYLFSQNNFNKLQTLTQNSQFNNIQFTIEPGFDLINSSGYLVSSITDIFKRKGKNIVILDTSVNHLPEVFEYNYTPDVINGEKQKDGPYILAGSTCLAGDIFGEYSFREPLKVGHHVIFKNIGAYSVVKAHQFNGLKLPKIQLTHIKKKGSSKLLTNVNMNDMNDMYNNIMYDQPKEYAA